MLKFQYIVRDRNQAHLSGQIEAVDSEAARKELEQSGLTVLELKVETTGSMPNLSATEALELTTQIAEIVKAGLPLAAGLRAMQADLPRGRFSKAVGVLAARVEAGAPVDEALSTAATRLPNHLRGMLAAGAHTNRLAEVLQQSLEYEQLKSETGRRVRSVLAYPLIILAMLLTWLAFVLFCLMPSMTEVFFDFGIRLPPVTEALVWLSGPGKWLMLAVMVALIVSPILLTLLMPTRPASWIFARLPLVGPLWRSRNLVGYCNLLSTLLDLSIPMPAALQLAADSLSDGELKAASQRAARQTLAGQSLSQSIAGLPAFPRALSPIVSWGEQMSAQSEALRSAGDLYRNRMESQIELLAMVAPPVVFVAVALATGAVLAATILPLISLITSLSG